VVEWIKWTPDGGIWLKRAPSTIKGMEGVLVRGSVTLHEGDIDFPYWDKYLRDCGILPPGESLEGSGEVS
jgi:hypothetical protein